MRGANLLLAFLAAIMLVLAGIPARASASACDPCPPDCPIMAKMASGVSMAARAAHPDKPRKSKSDCQQMAVCQAAQTMAALSFEQVRFVRLSVTPVILAQDAEVRRPSRPPDKHLRPPIRL
jgi:hypothetical protein